MAAASLLGLLAGCGYQTYESRLQETVKYWRYTNEMNQNLSAAWNSGQGIELRAPRQFRLIPPPQVEKDENGDPVPPPDDPRQPKYLNVELPGLVGAWEAEVAVGGDDGAEKSACYMYVLSNHELWLDKGPNASVVALGFHDDVVDKVTRALGVRLPEPSKWTTEFHPDRTGYTERKPYTTTTLTTERPLSGIPGHSSVAVYLHQVQDIRVVVLFVMPQEVDRRENLSKRIELCLQTLSVSGEKPQSGAGDPASRSKVTF